MVNMEDIEIKENLARVYEKIAIAAAKVNRQASEITLVAVTKTVPVEKIIIAINNGIKVIGENRVQEADDKYPYIPHQVEWHLVGHLQTNKVKKALEIFSMIQSVDSLHLALEIQKRALAVNKTIPVLIEVNTAQEESKFGIRESGLFNLVAEILKLSNVKLMGLMTLGPITAIQNKEQSRPCFRKLYELKEKIEAEFRLKLPYLSMGMSSDYEVAIEEGANMIRVGTAIFGSRLT
ncbi:MAG: YggS family pyridoxal phosphate-dependent enzyme [candidate division WOR-3 bacterium]